MAGYKIVKGRDRNGINFKTKKNAEKFLKNILNSNKVFKIKKK